MQENEKMLYTKTIKKRKEKLMSKYDLYNILKKGLLNQLEYDLQVEPYQEINYGIQFDVTLNGQKSKVRIYESKKKGVTLDLSQIKNEELKALIYNINSNGTSEKLPNTKSKCQEGSAQSISSFVSDQMEMPLIGVDESGKGDYFGPLVVAGVYANKEQKTKLKLLGVADSKALTDVKIAKLAEQIKAICQYEILVFDNERYNTAYHKIGNLNLLLAAGHAKVIDELVKRTGADVALSDQFGDEKLIKNCLREASRSITLEQRPRAEQNVVVAAASILARNAFVMKMQELELQYAQSFPKGASVATIQAGKRFVNQYGKTRLIEVAKLHFKTTENL